MLVAAPEEQTPGVVNWYRDTLTGTAEGVVDAIMLIIKRGD